MTTFIFILIIFFILLLTYQTFLAHFKKTVVEGNTSYQNYSQSGSNSAMILAQQNAGNISALKTQLDGLTNLKKTIHDISGNVASIQTQVNGLATAQQQSGEQLVGTKPPVISGTS